MKTETVTLSVHWNAEREAVEVDEILGKDFLNLPSEIDSFLCLCYTTDGCVLSAAASIQNLGDWITSIKGQGGRVVKTTCDRITVEVEIEYIDRPVSIREHGLNNWIINYDEREFSGFATRLRAERFLKRLFRDRGKLYFINHSNDFELRHLLEAHQNVHSEIGQAYYKIRELLVSKGYRNMRWSIESPGGQDSFYLDYYRLPEWTGDYYALQTTIDCNTGSFVEDYSATIVKLEDLSSAIEAALDLIQNWFNNNYMDDYDYVAKQIAEVLDETRNTRAQSH